MASILQSFDLREIIEGFDVTIGARSIAGLAETLRDDLPPDHPARSMKRRQWRVVLAEAHVAVWHHLPTDEKSRKPFEQCDGLYRLHEPSVQRFLARHRRYNIEVRVRTTAPAGDGSFAHWLDISKARNPVIDELRNADMGELINGKEDLLALFPDALLDARRAWAAYAAWGKLRASRCGVNEL